METEEYFKNNNMAVDIWNAKYAHKKEDRSLENVSEVFRRITDILGEEESQQVLDAWYNDMMEGWYRPAGSIITGVGSKEMISLANCTTIPMQGDSIKDIMKCMSDVMHCAARRQGLGVEMSPLRPAKAHVNNAAVESTGAVPWMSFIDSMGKYVGQQGRRPAILLSLNVGHPDIESFCTVKSDHDLIQNANISVQITDDFMEAVIADGDWVQEFVTPHETITRTVKATELFKLISKQACDNAEPGVQFIDAARKGSMIHQIYLATKDHKYKVISSNACVVGDSVVYVLIDGNAHILSVKDVVDVFNKGQNDIEILSFDENTRRREYQSVSFASKTRVNADLMKITDTETGKSIKCTPDHEVYTENRGYVRADKLQENDVLNVISENNIHSNIKIERLEEKEDVYDLTVRSNQNFYCDDILVHNCSEKFLPAYGSCMLGSINMGMFPLLPEEYKPILQEKAYNLLRLIDNAIQYELDEKRYGVDEQRIIMELTREVGLGFTNLHQWFINANVQYDSDEAIEMFEEFMSWYAFYVFEGSQKIAELKGPALAYSETGITSKDLMGSSFFKNIVDKFYEGDYTKVKPLRNLALISIAPTGTLSMTFPVPCISTGAEPGMSAHWRKTRAISKGEYDWYFILPEFIKFELMKEIVNSRVLCSDDLNFISNVGPATPDNTGELGIEVMELINKYLGKGTFKPAHEIDPMQKIKLMSGLYNWVDAAVSITYNLPEDTVAEEVENIYMQAWKQGVRAVSVYREGSREGILVFDPPGNEALKKTSYCETRPEEILFTCAPKRPQDLDCEIHHCKIKGKKFIVLIGMYNGYPYEVFAGEAHEDMYVPTTVKKGILRKIHAKYSLIVLIRGSEVEYRNIAFSFMNEQYRSLTRMISLSLRHGVRPAFITDQLKKADEGITEFSSVVSRVLNNYMKTKDYEYLNKKQKQGDICVLCGGTDWHNSGGCLVCSTCGRGSKCD